MFCLSPKESEAELPPKTIELVAVASPKVPVTLVLSTPFAISFAAPFTKQLLLKPFVVLSVPFIWIVFDPNSLVLPEPLFLLFKLLIFLSRFVFLLKALQVPVAMS